MCVWRVLVSLCVWVCVCVCVHLFCALSSLEECVCGCRPVMLLSPSSDTLPRSADPNFLLVDGLKGTEWKLSSLSVCLTLHWTKNTVIMSRNERWLDFDSLHIIVSGSRRKSSAFGSARLVLVNTDPLWEKRQTDDNNEGVKQVERKWICRAHDVHTHTHTLSTVESFSCAHALWRDSDPHGAADVSRLLTAVGQICVKLLCCTANHWLQSQNTLTYTHTHTQNSVHYKCMQNITHKSSSKLEKSLGFWCKKSWLT